MPTKNPSGAAVPATSTPNSSRLVNPYDVDMTIRDLLPPRLHSTAVRRALSVGAMSAGVIGIAGAGAASADTLDDEGLDSITPSPSAELTLLDVPFENAPTQFDTTVLAENLVSYSPPETTAVAESTASLPTFDVTQVEAGVSADELYGEIGSPETVPPLAVADLLASNLTPMVNDIPEALSAFSFVPEPVGQTMPDAEQAVAQTVPVQPAPPPPAPEAATEVPAPVQPGDWAVRYGETYDDARHRPSTNFKLIVGEYGNPIWETYSNGSDGARVDSSGGDLRITVGPPDYPTVLDFEGTLSGRAAGTAYEVGPFGPELHKFILEPWQE